MWPFKVTHLLFTHSVVHFLSHLDFPIFLFLPTTDISYHLSLSCFIKKSKSFFSAAVVVFSSELSLVIIIITLHTHTHILLHNASIFLWSLVRDGKDAVGQMSKIVILWELSLLVCLICLYLPIFLHTGEYALSPKRPTCWVQYPGLVMTDAHMVSKKILALFSATPISCSHCYTTHHHPHCSSQLFLSSSPLSLSVPLSLSLSKEGFPDPVVPGHSPVRKCVSSAPLRFKCSICSKQ